MNYVDSPSSLLTLLALLPGILILIYIFRKDKVEREPINLIARMVVLGAVSCVPAAVLEGIMDGALPGFQEGSLAYAVMISFFSAGLIEELCKFFMLRVGIFRNREFDYRFDGIVYGVSVAVGFAMLENVLYVSSGGLETAVVRAFLAVPLHAFCGVFMGALVGIAKKHYVDGNSGQSLKYQILAVLIPMLIHGGYDTLAFWEVEFAFILLLAYVCILYVIGIRLINRLSRDDAGNRIYPEEDADSQEQAYQAHYEGQAGRTYGGAHTGNLSSHQGWKDMNDHQGYRTGYGSNSVKRTNGMSKASAVCGIISFISTSSFGLPAILAIVFGIAGLRQTPPGGSKTAAKAGIILGAISLAINIGLVSTYI